MKQNVFLGFVIVFLFFENINCVAQNDSIKKPFTFYRIGIDVAKLGASLLRTDYNTLELQFETNGKKATNYILETGFSRSFTNNDFVSFKSNASFLRLGLEKTFFSSEYFGDRDNAFAGFRYGGAWVQNLEGIYTIQNPLWGNQMGNIESYNFYAHWIELVGGFKLEIKKNIFIGWTIRGKTFLNATKIKQHTPVYLAGYGNAEKQPGFDYNFYLLYGIGKR